MSVARGWAVARRRSGRGGGGESPPPRSVSAFYPTFPTTQANLHISSTDVTLSPAPRESAKSRASAVSGGIGGQPGKTACRSPFCTCPCRLGASVRRCAFCGAVGYPSATCAGRPVSYDACNEDHASARPDPRAAWRRIAAAAALQRQRSDDPAALIPARRPGLRRGRRAPRRQVRSDLEGALKKILRTDDPGAKIQNSRHSGKGEGVTFKDDVDPWLGDRVGIAVTALHNGRDADYVAVISSTDDAKAALWPSRRAPSSAPTRAPTTASTQGKTASAVIEHRVVIGTEAG